MSIEIFDGNQKVIGSLIFSIQELINQPDMEFSCQQFELKQQGRVKYFMENLNLSQTRLFY